MTIRTLRAEERHAWLRLRRALFPDCSEAMHTFEMDRYLDRGFSVFVAEVTDEVVGFAEVSVRERVEHSTEDHVGYLEAWYVAPTWQGRGVGRRLTEATERVATCL